MRHVESIQRVSNVGPGFGLWTETGGLIRYIGYGQVRQIESDFTSGENRTSLCAGDVFRPLVRQPQESGGVDDEGCRQSAVRVARRPTGFKPLFQIGASSDHRTRFGISGLLQNGWRTNVRIVSHGFASECSGFVVVPQCTAAARAVIMSSARMASQDLFAPRRHSREESGLIRGLTSPARLGGWWCRTSLVQGHPRVSGEVGSCDPTASLADASGYYGNLVLQTSDRRNRNRTQLHDLCFVVLGSESGWDVSCNSLAGALPDEDVEEGCCEEAYAD